MKKILTSLIIAVSLLLAGCVNESVSERIARLEKQAFSTDGNVEPQMAEQLVNAYCDFATQYPDDEMSAEYLFKAIDVSMNFDQPQKTLLIINELAQKYPDYEQTSTAIFVKGFIYETRYNNVEQAKAAYEEYLELYPDGALAPDCRASIENLGLSPDELVRKFESMDN